MEITRDGRMKRRAGFGLPFSDKLYDNLGRLLSDYGPDEDPYTGPIYRHNHDYHHQGLDEREPITFLHESTRDDGNRFLFGGTQSKLVVLNEATGYWTDLATDKGAFGSRWKADQLNNVLYFTNDADNILAYDLDAGTIGEVDELKNTVKITAAKVVIQYLGFLVLMNVVRDGKRQATQVAWSDQGDGSRWDAASADPLYGETLTGFQDLTYGDDILGAAMMHNNVYIYTRRGIWRMSPSDSDTVDTLPSHSGLL